MGVAELEHRLSDAEILEWAQFYALEPFGDDRVELMLAQIMMMLSSFMGAKIRFDDFFISKRVKQKDKDIEKEMRLCFGF
ncbi:phage tail assembly protein T [Campylobacter geochelonis]|uniref:Minor tail T domain-containing protein n=1 Tax=Campylobacter geochelonis TaxID=1780362 RepID=A0A128ENF2_9BACT|nr:hypothetical protein [Campylobacter geochelonis]QKF70769.1 hypothetical protein CGEO_0439 [Campylobacter geochelonis]CZE47311.1 Uncharacterised protein [Campylobacter geochelonis]CZE48628.1 Uncharacterised protein [Campylobacter geochelonis]CZE50538.1 Uncharacterised protein [Campylobacter geochelonis]